MLLSFEFSYSGNKKENKQGIVKIVWRQDSTEFVLTAVGLRRAPEIVALYNYDTSPCIVHLDLVAHFQRVVYITIFYSYVYI